MQINNVSGHGNTVVQIVGSNNEISVGQPHLVLTLFKRVSSASPELAALSPHARSLVLTGRDEELSSLTDFLTNDSSISIRVLIGGTGVGKSRLAVELCESAIALGWNAGFVVENELARFASQQNLSTWQWNKPTLIVVDSAAQYSSQLAPLLLELAQIAEAPRYPLRLLLLDRHASSESGWFHDVFHSGDWAALPVQDLLNPPEPIRIRPLAKVDDRLSILQGMLEAFEPVSLNTLPVADENFQMQLMQLDWGGEPLFLMMAALEMIRIGNRNVLEIERNELAFSLAKIELRRIEGLASSRNIDPKLVHHLAACVTLAQGMSPSACQEFSATEKDLIGRSNGGAPAEIVDLLRDAFPGQSGIAPVSPDLIGEAFILCTLPYDNRGVTAILRCHKAFGMSVIEVVTRCAQDFVPKTMQPLQWVEALVQIAKFDTRVLKDLDTVLPSHSTVLRDQKLMVSKLLCALHTSDKDVSKIHQADALHNLASSQIESRHIDGVATMKQAIFIYRELSKVLPEKHTKKLACALTNLSMMLNVERKPNHNEALQVAQEASNLYFKLIEERPTNSLRNGYGGSLLQQAIALHQFGDSNTTQQNEAFGKCQQAISIYRALASEDTDYLPELAMTVTNISYMHQLSASYDTALSLGHEAIELFDRLAAKSPDEFLPELARAFNNQANTLAKLNKLDDAYSAWQKALKILRKLARLNPDAFQGLLANTLCNLVDCCRGRLDGGESSLNSDFAEYLKEKAMCIGNMGEHAEALSALLEAVPIFRKLDADNPKIYRLRLAAVLNDLSLMFIVLKRPQEALAALEEAINIREHLSPEQLREFRGDLAAIIGNQANFLRECGNIALALDRQKEVIKLIRELANEQPGKFKQMLANSLRNYSIALRETHEYRQSLNLLRECLKIESDLFAQNPSTELKDQLAWTNTELMVTHCELDEYEEALVAAQESVRIYRDISLALPDRFLPRLAGALSNASLVYIKMGRFDLALSEEQKASEIARSLASQRPEEFCPRLANSLTGISQLQRRTEHYQAALESAREALEINKALAIENPESFTVALAMSHMEVGLRLHEMAKAAMNGKLNTPENGTAREAIHNGIFAPAELWKAISTLRPQFLASPAAFQQPMRNMLGTYYIVSTQTSIPPDVELIRSILPSMTNT